MDAVNLQGVWLNFPVATVVVKGHGFKGMTPRPLEAGGGGAGKTKREAQAVSHEFVMAQMREYEREKEEQELIDLVLFLDMV